VGSRGQVLDINPGGDDEPAAGRSDG